MEAKLVPHHVAASLHEEAPSVPEAAVVLPVALHQECALLAQHHKARPLAQLLLQ